MYIVHTNPIFFFSFRRVFGSEAPCDEVDINVGVVDATQAVDLSTTTTSIQLPDQQQSSTGTLYYLSFYMILVYFLLTNFPILKSGIFSLPIINKEVVPLGKKLIP